MDRYIPLAAVCISLLSGASGFALGHRSNSLSEVGVMITLNQNYERRLGQFRTATSLDADDSKLSALRSLMDSMTEEAGLGHRLTNNLVSEIVAAIKSTEDEISRKESERQRAAAIAEAEKKAKEDNDRQAEADAAKKREEDRIQRELEDQEREAQRKADEVRAANRRLEERLLRDERVCFDDACRNWIMR